MLLAYLFINFRMKDNTTNQQFEKNFVPRRWQDIFINAVKQALKVSWMILKIYIPVSLFTAFLERIGFLAFIAPFFEPLMKLLGLPGEAALVLIAAYVNNLFAALAAASVIDLTFRQITIIAIVTGFAHNLFVETGVLMKLKMGRAGIAFSRIIFGLLVGFVMNLIMPEDIRGVILNPYAAAGDFSWINLLLKVSITGLQIIALMFVIMLIYELLILWKHSAKIKEKLTVFTRMFDMSPAALAPWMVGTFIGIAYGAGILFRLNKDRRLNHKDVCLLTVSMCLVHAVIEDTMIFVLVGANLWWLLGVRVLLMIIILSIISRGKIYKKLTWLGLPKEESTAIPEK